MMTLADRVAQRWIQAKSSWTWADVEGELKQLQMMHRVSKGRIDERTAKKLAEMPTFDMLPHAFAEWYRLAYDKADHRLLSELAGDAKHGWQRVVWAYKRQSEGEGPRVVEERIQTAQKATEEYILDVNEAIRDVGPARLTHQGFKIGNHDRMPEDMLKRALDKIDWLVDFFKRQGMLKLLKETLTKIDLEMRAHETAAAHYHSQTKHITMHRGGLLATGGKLWKDWIHEVFIHEIGHHIHYYLHPEAWAIWEAPWKEVEKKERVRGVLTGQQREQFWKLLANNNFNPSTTAKKLKGIDKVRFAQWLRHPILGGSLITPKTFRPSKWGKSVFDFLKDPVGYKRLRYPNDPIEDVEEDARQSVVRRRRGLGLEDFTSMEIPLSPEIVDELRKHDPSVEEAIKALEIPSQYGETNFKEDFAETFVVFMTNPSKLSATARFRMKRALAVSGLFGKSVGKFGTMAERVAGRFTATCCRPASRRCSGPLSTKAPPG